MMDADIGIGQLIREAIALNPDAYRQADRLAAGTGIALWIVFFAGLSESLAQAIVLFLNQVKPFRFVISLAIGALLFVFGFLFWAVSTWLVSAVFLRGFAPFIQLTRTLALSYSPKLLSIFIALPYFGVPISIVLSIWSFLAFLVGIQASLGLGLREAFLCGILGWVVFQILQHTIGRPVASLGHWLRSTVAGVTLITDLKDLEHLVNQGRRR